MDIYIHNGERGSMDEWATRYFNTALYILIIYILYIISVIIFLDFYRWVNTWWVFAGNLLMCLFFDLEHEYYLLMLNNFFSNLFLCYVVYFIVNKVGLVIHWMADDDEEEEEIQDAIRKTLGIKGLTPDEIEEEEIWNKGKEKAGGWWAYQLQLFNTPYESPENLILRYYQELKLNKIPPTLYPGITDVYVYIKFKRYMRFARFAVSFFSFFEFFYFLIRFGYTFFIYGLYRKPKVVGPYSLYNPYCSNAAIKKALDADGFWNPTKTERSFFQKCFPSYYTTNKTDWKAINLATRRTHKEQIQDKKFALFLMSLSKEDSKALFEKRKLLKNKKDLLI